MSAIAVKLNPKLWQQIKNQILWGDKYGVPGEWNARKAQIASKLYKDRGGKYSADTPQNTTSLHKWTAENWGYISPDSNRYLPQKVRESLTDTERAVESATKTTLGERAPYSDTVLEKMRNR